MDRVGINIIFREAIVEFRVLSNSNSIYLKIGLLETKFDKNNNK